MIYGVGIDLVEIYRIEDAISRWNHRFINRVYTRREIDDCGDRRSKGEYYALRFAAKEAFVKALGLGLREGIRWLDIEIADSPLGKPEVNLYDQARNITKAAGVKNIFISLSHTRNFGTAVVVLEV